MDKAYKKLCLESLEKWKKNGGKIGTYTCPYCDQRIETHMPEPKNVDSKGYWDSATKCYECGFIIFIKKYPSGKTVTKRIETNKPI